MAEQGLVAKVIPKMDAPALDAFIGDLTSSLSELNLNVNPTVSSSSSSESTTTTQKAETTDTAKDTKSASERAADKQAEKETLKEISQEEAVDVPLQEKKNKTIIDRLKEMMSKSDDEDEANAGRFSTLTSAISEGLSAVPVIGGAMLSVTDGIEAIIARLKEASPLLRTVSSLIEMAFSMVLMPIGNILGMELIPMLTSMFSTLSEWQTAAYEIYEREGWVGLLTEVIGVAWDLFMDIWNTAVKQLWDGLKENEYVGKFFTFVENAFNWVLDNLKNIILLFGTFLGLYIGYETAKLANDSIGILSQIPGATLLTSALGIGVGAGVGYMMTDEILKQTGLSDVLDTASSLNDNVTSSSSVSEYTSTRGSTVYSSSNASSAVGGSYVNNFNISGLSDEQLVNKIRTEVNQQTNLSRTRIA